MSQLRRSAAGERETVATLADDAESVQLDQLLNSRLCRVLQLVGRCNQRATEPAAKQAVTVCYLGGGLQCRAGSSDIGKHPSGELHALMVWQAECLCQTHLLCPNVGETQL